MRLTHQSLRERLLELPAPRRLSLTQACQKLAEAEGLADPRNPLPFQLMPLVLDAGEVGRALAPCQTLVDALVCLERYAMRPEGEDLRLRLLGGVGEAGRRLFDQCSFESDYSLERRFRRIDAMIDAGSGRCRALEVNQAAPSFLHFHDALQRVAAEALGRLGFSYEPALLAPRIVEWLAGEHRQRHGAGANLRSVAVVSEEGFPFKLLELPPFAKSCERFAREALGLETRFSFCYPHELRLREGRAWLGGEPVDMVWRNSALLDAYAGREGDIKDYLQLCSRPEDFLIVNSTRVWLTLTKDALSLLSDGASLDRLGLSPEQRASLLETVPHTGSLSLDPGLKGRVLGERDEWVSKPAAGSFGQGFEAGRDHTDASWRELVRERSRPGFVAQRLVRPSTVTLFEIDGEGGLVERPATYEICPHHVDGRLSGTLLIRAIPLAEGARGRVVPAAVA